MSAQAMDTIGGLTSQIRQGQVSIGTVITEAQRLIAQGQHLAASNLYALWIRLAPAADRRAALFNQAGILQMLNRLDEAKVNYEQCITAYPDFGEAYVNLGLLHEKRGNLPEAIATWQRFLLRQPPNGAAGLEILTAALNHIGRVFEATRQYKEAEIALEQSLALKPDQPGVIQHWVHIRQKACNWPIYKPLPGLTYSRMRHATSPLALIALNDDPAEHLKVADLFVKRTYEFPDTMSRSNALGPRRSRAKVRIGYVSADFREHAVGFLLPEVIRSHDRTQFEVFAYDHTSAQQTVFRQELLGLFDHVRSTVNLSDEEVANLVQDDQIDVLIDLHGLSSGARPGIFARRPAPLQGTFLGFIGPTAMPWLDFVVCDQHVLPPSLEPWFTEKPLRVKGSFLPVSQDPINVEPISREELEVNEECFLMGSFGNVYKITPEMFECWLRLLDRIPGSILALIDDNPATTHHLRKEAAALNADISRIRFLPRVDHEVFTRRLQALDVFLDTWPYNCGSTSVDVLRAGVPLVTMAGRTMVSRMGLSLLAARDEQADVAWSFREYEQRVVDIANSSKPRCIERKQVSFSYDQELLDLIAQHPEFNESRLRSKEPA